MATINSLLAYLDERAIARRIGIPNDEARLNYHLTSNTVSDYDQFRNITTDYYIYHYARCVSNGGRLSSSEAYGRIVEALEKEYRKKRGDIVSAFNDANTGTNGGLRSVLDILCEAIKADSMERYVRDIFDRHVAPNSWDQRLDMTRQFIAYAGPYLSSSIVVSQPERYAHDWSELIRSYVEGLRHTSSMFRRL